MRLQYCFYALFVPTILLFTWQAGSILELFPSTILPPPVAVGEVLWDSLRSGEMLSNLLISIRRTITGLSIGVFIGLLLGVTTATIPILDGLLSPVIIGFRQIPMFAWMPMIILVCGIEEMSKVVFIAIGTFYPIVINTYDGIKNVPDRFLEVAGVFECSRIRTFFRVILPAAFPSILTGLRFSISLSWMLVVGAEILGSDSGIGFIMTWSRQTFQLDMVFACVIVVGLLGIAINSSVTFIERKILIWRGGDNGNGI